MCERVGHHPGVPDRGPEGAVDQDVVLGRPVPPPGGEPRGRVCIRVLLLIVFYSGPLARC